ncbi:hypothetical protein [Protofrankia symbiont of Coriaria ruscifolia]|uniref:hypothetical protein n=1 Tax=Protofrankia symbiont of Coriaria ruscifolia TaxID=1306542 RepID=UPI001F5F94D8|nr:hypothetical protein [Protofrankia symbiont of Coriaria ruscifolia]
MANNNPGREIPFFDGVGALLTLIRSLALNLKRPRSAPLICLVADPGSGPWLASVRNRVQLGLQQDGPLSVRARLVRTRHRILGSAPRMIPHAYFDLASDAPGLPVPDPPHMLPVLHTLFNQLRRTPFGLGSRFRTYTFADWLTRQQLDPPPRRSREEELTERLREKLKGAGNGIGPNPLLDGISGLARLLLAVLIILGPKMRFLLWRSSRIPIPGLVRTSWFMGQQSFRALPGETFVDFAIRLIDTATQDQLKRLLVDAFLHDLQVAYRRRPWRSRSWRRTARVLVLLDNVADDPQGDQFLKLVAAVRNTSRKPDPLLLVAGYQDDAVPQSPEPSPLAAADATDAFDIWNTAEPPGDMDWRLWLWVPTFVRTPPGLTIDPDAEGWGRYLSAPPPPAWARRRVLVSLTLVVVLLAGMINLPTIDGWFHGCWSRAGVSVSWVDGQCIGYSDGSYRFNAGKKSAPADQLLTIQGEIAEQNRCAAKLASLPPGQFPSRLMTLVYFAGLTGETESDWTAAQVTELAGLLTWQYTLNQRQDLPECRHTAGGPSEVTSPAPRAALRVIIANGGSRMKYADRVASDYLVPLASHAGENVLGVIGVDRSTSDTGQAITTLGKARVPVVATTLSGDAMEIFSPSYFQMVPDNQRQAQLVTDYGVKNNKKMIDVYYPRSPDDPSSQGWPAVEDFYVSTLVHDVQKEATRIGLPYELHGWGPGENTPSWFHEQCARSDREGLIFFAGRYNDFPNFLDGMHSCLDRVLADDSVSRYVVQAAGRWTSATAFRFVSKGAPVLLGGGKCLNGNLTTGPFVTKTLKDFCHRLKNMYEATGITRPQTLWADERIGLSYDAAKLFVDVVNENPEIDRDNIEKRLRKFSPSKCEDANFSEVSWPGATGCVDFRDSQVAQSKQLTIIYIDLSWKELPESDPSNQDPETDDNQPCKFVISGREPRTSNDCLHLGKWPLSPTVGG